MTTSIYYQDPDGNFVELQVDNFQTPEETTGYMEGAEYDHEPVAAVDPSTSDEFVRRRRWAATVHSTDASFTRWMRSVVES